MEVKEFQEKLIQLCALAEKNNKILEGPQIKDFFEGMDLNRSQLIKVLQYLKTMGITIEGADAAKTGTDDSGTETDSALEPEKKIVPLTAEEQSYLNDYLAGLTPKNRDDRSPETLFQNLVNGDDSARQALTEHFMPAAAQMAAEMNCTGIFIADLIQEANLGLLMALAQPVENADEEWLKKEIRAGIIRAIEEQTERKFSDDCLVAKVEKLESAVRELSEDEEDEENKFSIGELAIILDMDAEEIRDVLRLTGDAQ